MFQYAAGRALSLKHNTELMLDLDAFLDSDSNRKYNLDVFGLKNNYHINFNKSNVIKNKPILDWQPSEHKFSNYTIYKQPFISFDPNFANYPNDCYLDGYWQSTKYFLKYEKAISEDFQFNNSIFDEYGDLIDKIVKVNSVAIHLRRGDYVSDRQTNLVHGALDVEYYIDAVDFISDKQLNPHYFVFSDDPEWVQANLSTIKPITYMGKLNPDVVDLYLMSVCKHQIVANSTFSWWAAWLNKNPDKIVVAPKKWFSNKDLNNQIGDLIPNNWRKI